MHALTRISKLTEEMAQAAAEADWDRVQLHDAERYELLAALPASCFESGDPAVQIVLEQALMMTNAVRARSSTNRPAACVACIARSAAPGPIFAPKAERADAGPVPQPPSSRRLRR